MQVAGPPFFCAMRSQREAFLNGNHITYNGKENPTMSIVNMRLSKNVVY